MPSTVIVSIMYDPPTKNLTVGFVSGLVYTYHNDINGGVLTGPATVNLEKINLE
ncbi:MAG TPA: KTSC domain-containing protein [Parafilimonas sp.]|nr:KTSC domain-containing protein [Parafilimonas sp.]